MTAPPNKVVLKSDLVNVIEDGDGVEEFFQKLVSSVGEPQALCIKPLNDEMGAGVAKLNDAHDLRMYARVSACLRHSVCVFQHNWLLLDACCLTQGSCGIGNSGVVDDYGEGASTTAGLLRVVSAVEHCFSLISSSRKETSEAETTPYVS